jgi:diphosphomevalonate decarboxylase
MPPWTAIGVSCPNIAFIKYWGNRDHSLRLPSNGSISMNLDGLYARTQVAFDQELAADEFSLGGRRQGGAALERVSALLERVRRLAGIRWQARVSSQNNFPTGTGIASSAAAFAALSLAASRAAGLELNERALSRLARTGSGSACRSVPGGFVEWQAGESDADSYAFSIAPAGHWDLVDCVAIVSREHKPTGSSQGHALADSSPLQAARVADAPRRLDACRYAILKRDFSALAEVVELDSNLMHAIMITSTPPLLYWLPATMGILHSVPAWRYSGLPVCYTIDAGPNVHVLTTASHTEQVAARLRQIPGVTGVLTAPAGPAAHWEEA